MGFASSHATEDHRARDLVSKHPRDLVERDNHAAANLQRLRKQQHAGHVAEDQSSRAGHGVVILARYILSMSPLDHPLRERLQRLLRLALGQRLQRVPCRARIRER